MANNKAAKSSKGTKNQSSSSGGLFNVFLLITIGLAIAAIGYKYAQDSDPPASTARSSVPLKSNPIPRNLGSMETFKPKHAEGVAVADFSKPGLDKIRMRHRVIDIINGLHWDDLLQDMPDEMRPPSALWFFDPTDQECARRYEEIKWDSIAEEEMPSRERLLAARYNMHAGPVRAWYKFTPEMDLKKRFKVTSCPELVFVPRKCNGETEWCSRGADPTDPEIEIMGCENFKDQCTGFESWNGEGDWVQWLLERIEREGEPKIPEFLGSYKEVHQWIISRDHTTIDNHLRNIYYAQSFPAFTHRGFKAMPIPEAFYDWLLKFYNSHVDRRTVESWSSAATQVSFHERPTSIVSLDMVAREKEAYANQYLKPIIEEWSGMPNLELTSFYGIREYPLGSILKNHIDRIDTHVLSVTMTVLKYNQSENPQPWFLDAVQWTGDHVRYKHPAGMMVLYESSKLIHGRIQRNKESIHVGCFLHYRPRDMGKGGGKWREIVSSAEKYFRENTYYASYKSAPPVEPRNPQFTSTNYGEGSSFEHSRPNDSTPFTVEFVSAFEEPLNLYWIAPKGDKVLQHEFKKSDETKSINTFVGHKFGVSKKGSEKILAEYTMRRGVRQIKLDI